MAVVTGGAQGIGLAIAERFIEAGAKVIIGDKNEAAADSSAKVLAERFAHTCLVSRWTLRDQMSFQAAARVAVQNSAGSISG